MWHTLARLRRHLGRGHGIAALSVLLLLSPAPSMSEEPLAKLTGKLLVAAETMGDPRFRETVIFIVDHDQQSGALGLVVNQPLGDMPLEALFDGIGADAPPGTDQIRAHYGGPVEPWRIFLLLPPSSQQEGSPTPAVVASLDNILRVIGDKDRPAQSMFVLGYAGWSPGQLEAEIAAGDWDIIPFEETLVFGGEFEQMWDRAILRRAVEL